jgi:adenine-specific DNA-methyltransferase
VRYIGNKTKLLGFLADVLTQVGIAPGRAHDAFAGTASVARSLKASGWRVESSDVMTYSYVFQRAYVVARHGPDARRVAAGDADLRRALRARTFAPVARDGLSVLAEYLSTWVEPERGFISQHFSAASGRMYFTDENARRIDGARHALHRWSEAGLVSEDAYYLLLAAIIEAADRVANTAGIYAAYIKKWQPNATKTFRMQPARPASRAGGSRAHREDATAVARKVGRVDLLYVDPPYNARQYSGYYHIPEIIAKGWFGDLPVVRGKTGLPVDRPPPSAWCNKAGAAMALDELLGATGARHVLVSYNTEGILPDAQFLDILGNRAVAQVQRFEQPYKRYRADQDGERRRYRASGVNELVYYLRIRK